MGQTLTATWDYVEYDRYVTDRFLGNPAFGFMMADPVGIGYSFHPAKLNLDFQDRVAGASSKQKKKTKKSAKSEGIPDGYPEGLLLLEL